MPEKQEFSPTATYNFRCDFSLKTVQWTVFRRNTYARETALFPEKFTVSKTAHRAVFEDRYNEI